MTQTKRQFKQPPRCCPSPRRRDRPRTIKLKLVYGATFHYFPHSTDLTDILVADSADLLDIGGALRHVLHRVSVQDDLVLDVGRSLNSDTREELDLADNLLTDKVTN
jgi:hypothetical protein